MCQYMLHLKIPELNRRTVLYRERNLSDTSEVEGVVDVATDSRTKNCDKVTESTS